jgi:hypothetical protein
MDQEGPHDVREAMLGWVGSGGRDRVELYHILRLEGLTHCVVSRRVFPTRVAPLAALSIGAKIV